MAFEISAPMYLSALRCLATLVARNQNVADVVVGVAAAGTVSGTWLVGCEVGYEQRLPDGEVGRLIGQVVAIVTGACPHASAPSDIQNLPDQAQQRLAYGKVDVLELQ